ncbi:MAG: glycosyltransferase [Candidatus Omnitrophica bacterium]|nr:glycosyltransferase [Candidatus Omnitrophota bacterium]
MIFDTYRPDTTGGYFERACQALGMTVEHWWLRDVARIPEGYDLYLRIDCGDGYDIRLPPNLRPVVFYAIDTHLPHSWEKIRRMAPQFDLVCCCHRDASLRLPDAVWLPVAGDPTMPAEHHGMNRFDVAFVGTDGGRPRKFYLQALRERYPQSFIGKADYRDLMTIYGQARIGFNYSIGNDVNMRIFEVLAARTLLVTNALANDDLGRLGLEDRRHLVLYRRPAEVVELIDYYLAHEEEREQIAASGAEVVRARHTYVHRMRQLLMTVSHRLGVPLPIQKGTQTNLFVSPI